MTPIYNKNIFWAKLGLLSEIDAHVQIYIIYIYKSHTMIFIHPDFTI